MNKTVAVVVTYNRCDMLAKCVVALLRQSSACSILIVDNCSSDGTADYISSLNDPRIFSLRMSENVGGAGGFNAGMRWAVENNYQFVWLMDDDCFPAPDALEKLMEADRILDGDYGFLSSSVLWTDGKECRMNRQKIRRNYYLHMDKIRYALISVEQATFVSLLVRREMIVKAGLPLKEFFIWGDDIEYTRRLSVRMKKPCFLVGKSIVTHAMKQNSGSDISLDHPERLDRYGLAYRNENYFYRKEGLKGFSYYTCRCFYHSLKVLLNARSHRLKRLWVIFSSYFRGFFFNPAVEFVGSLEECGVEANV